MTAKKFFAELIGTFTLVFFGCGVAAVTGCDGAVANSSYAMTALAFGLVIVAMAYSIGRISGCHVNPAVSLGARLSGRMTSKEFWIYLLAQVCGAILGAVLLAALIGTGKGLGCNGLFEGNAFKSQ